MIGFAALAILPARVGDVLRPYLLARQEGLPLPATFATVVMERVLDLIAVLVLLAIYVWGFADDTRPAGPRCSRPIEVSAALAGGRVGGADGRDVGAGHASGADRAVWCRRRTRPARPMVGPRRQPGRAHSAAASRPRASRARCSWRVLWSFPLWLAIAAEAWAVTVAFGIDMPFAGTFLLQALLVIGVAVPDSRRRRQLSRGLPHRRDDVLRRARTTGGRCGHRHARHLVRAGVLLGIVFMAQDGLSFGGLKDLAGRGAREGREGRGSHR